MIRQRPKVPDNPAAQKNMMTAKKKGHTKLNIERADLGPIQYYLNE